MADPRDPHAEHDPLIVAALLDRDLAGEERAIAEARIASCASCAALHADLLALSVGDEHAADPGASACIHAHGRRRSATGRGGRRGTGQHDAPSDRCHDRSVHLVRPCLARHHPRRLARRSLAAGQRAHRRRGARRRLRPVRRPPCRSARTAGRDPGDAHAAAADRLHADPARRGPAPFGRLAPLRGDPRDVARRAQPAAGGRAHDARSGRAARGHAPVLLDGRRDVRPDGHDRCAGRRRRRSTPATAPRWRHRRRPKPAASAAPLPATITDAASDPSAAAPAPAAPGIRGRRHAGTGYRGRDQRLVEGPGRRTRPTRASTTRAISCSRRRSAASRPWSSCRSRS